VPERKKATNGSRRMDRRGVSSRLLFEQGFAQEPERSRV